MVWRRGLNQVIASRAWDIVFNINRNKHDLLPNGSLLVKYLRPEDSGEYYCNGDMVADVEVLTGQDYQVSAGRTIFLPCRISDKLKQKWIFRKNRRSVRKVILLKYKNGTVTKEIDDPQNRFITSDSELRIFNLQPMDAGEYFCNGVKSATLTVTTVATAAPDDIDRVTTKETDREPEESETKNKGSKGVSAPAVIGLFVLVLLSTLVCVSFWAAGKNTDKACLREEGQGRSWVISTGLHQHPLCLPGSPQLEGETTPARGGAPRHLLHREGWSRSAHRLTWTTCLPGLPKERLHSCNSLPPFSCCQRCPQDKPGDSCWTEIIFLFVCICLF